MGGSWTSEQVLSLAPDEASAKAGRQLATPSRWPLLGRAEGAAWGECKGSGKKPYQVRIDLAEPAFKCSCPSRKFPCKHALGLFLLLAESPKRFKEGEPPAWVADWLAARAERQEKKAAKAAEPKQAPDPKAKAKREQQRAGRVADGLDVLETWLVDLVTEGLAAAPAKPGSFWRETAAAMVNCQAPGLGRMVREAEALAASGEGWQRRLLEHLSRMWLLAQAGRGQEALPEDLRAEVRALLGYTTTREEVVSQGEQAVDRWSVVGQVIEEDERLITRRTWLWGDQGNRPALILDFAAGGRPLEGAMAMGTSFAGDVRYYPSPAPLRALVVDVDGAGPGAPVSGDVTWRAAMERVSAEVARSPWRTRSGLLLWSVEICRDGGGAWGLIDGEDRWAPMAPFAGLWRMLAIGAGQPISVFGEWDGSALLPLSVSMDGQLWDLRTVEEAA
ncbi:MAG: SWIM zinc finger family protein [Phycisphaerales bacterium JB039]